MDNLFGFFLTPAGATLSGVCTIASLIFGLFQKTKVTHLSSKVEAQNNTITTLQAEKIELTQKNSVLNDSNNKLTIENSKLSNTVNNLDKGDISTVNQHGKTNFNAKTVQGDVTFEVN